MMLTDGTVIEQVNNVVIATVGTRELSLRQLTELIDELMQKMRCDNAQHVLLDMATVDFIPSACLGSLVMFLQDLEHVRGRIGLVHCRPDVLFVFKVTRLDSVFHLFDDMEKAMAEIVRR
ncbi:MAG: STAS domain-containing protein [Phycisphaeraceae bacterium]|nr:STAS domain-containing protein [Phycisphaeraceae bacterium]